MSIPAGTIAKISNRIGRFDAPGKDPGKEKFAICRGTRALPRSGYFWAFLADRFAAFAILTACAAASAAVLAALAACAEACSEMSSA